MPRLSSSRSERRCLQRRHQPTPIQPISAYLVCIYIYIYIDVPGTWYRVSGEWGGEGGGMGRVVEKATFWGLVVTSYVSGNGYTFVAMLSSLQLKIRSLPRSGKRKPRRNERKEGNYTLHCWLEEINYHSAQSALTVYIGRCWAVLYHHQSWVVSSILAGSHLRYFRACALATL